MGIETEISPTEHNQYLQIPPDALAESSCCRYHGKTNSSDLCMISRLSTFLNMRTLIFIPCFLKFDILKTQIQVNIKVITMCTQ